MLKCAQCLNPQLRQSPMNPSQAALTALLHSELMSNNYRHLVTQWSTYTVLAPRCRELSRTPISYWFYLTTRFNGYGAYFLKPLEAEHCRHVYKATAPSGSPMSLVRLQN